MRRLAVFVLCAAVLATLLPAVEAANTAVTRNKRRGQGDKGKRKPHLVEAAAFLPTNHRDFWSVECRSAAYELSISSFASVWMMINAVVFVFAFAVFLKHCCYKAFTEDTTKGY